MNNNTGVIEKCTFCLVRTREGMLPSCTQSCPTGALGYKNGEPGVNDFPGFPETGTAPSIQIIRTNERRSPIGRILLPPEEESLFNKTTTRLKPSRQWGHDLPLVIFTVLAAILTSLTTAMVLGAYRVSPWHFLLPGLTGMVVSLMHLGKKFRAWRSVSNLKTSWLSREILSFGLLLFFGMTGLMFHESRLALPAAAISGIFCLVSIDMLYRKIPRPEPERKNSSGLLIFTWPLFVALFLDLTVVAAFILLIRAIFYLRKHWRYRTLMTRTNIAGMTFRITAGFLIPWILMLLFPFEHAKLWILLLVTMGELADRFEFYSEISVLSPEEIYHSMLISQQGDQ
jgi:DMSO reductase anchor subunit